MTYQRERNAIQSECRLAMSGSFRFAIRLAYDGSDYLGFQSQPHGNTIQDQIEIRLRAMLRRNLRIFGWCVFSISAQLEWLECVFSSFTTEIIFPSKPSFSSCIVYSIICEANTFGL